MKKMIPIILIALIFIVGLGVLSYPLVSSVVTNLNDRSQAYPTQCRKRRSIRISPAQKNITPA